MTKPLFHADASIATAELAANTAVAFEQSRAMPRSVYTSKAFEQAEIEGIFARDWYCLGRADTLKKPGDYTTANLAGRPIMVIMGADGQIRAQSNVCLHRMSTLLEGNGNTKSIVCPYHAWTYGLDGTLRGAPAMDKNQTFDKASMCLPQLRLENWHGWLLVNLDPDAPDPSEHLAEAAALMEPYGIREYKQTFHEQHHWNTNWKVLAENFMESYHLPVCHAGTIGGTVDLLEMDCPAGGSAYNYHTILKDPKAPLTNAHPDNKTLRGEMRRTTLLLTVYPSLLITLTPGYFWYLCLHPDGPDHVQITYGGGLSPDYVDDPKAQEHFAALKTLLDAVNMEDKGCTEKVYRGLSSSLANPGPLSHLERPNFEFAQYVHRRVSDYLGAE